MLESVLFYAGNLALILAVAIAIWPVSIVTKDPSYIDSFWPIGFVILAGTSAYLSGESLQQPMILLTALWGFRLGLHLFTRWLHEGADRRYKAIRARAKSRPNLFILVYVFVMQAVLLWLVALPIQHGVNANITLDAPLAKLGLVFFAVGFLFETIGDWQLSRFKSDPANAGKVMDRGLWRYTRHPNYFGDACVFWGLWLICVSGGAGYWTVIGPLFLTFTLVKWSGKALLEKNLKQSRPGYEDYIQRTPGFLPWFPKRADETPEASES